MESTLGVSRQWDLTSIEMKVRKQEKKEEMREGQGCQTSAQGHDDKCAQNGRREKRNEDEKGRKSSENQCVFKPQ